MFKIANCKWQVVNDFFHEPLRLYHAFFGLSMVFWGLFFVLRRRQKKAAWLYRQLFC